MSEDNATSLPPYPRLGECYRLLAKALDTKASNRQLDRLAREGDFDWQLLELLRTEIIELPLRAKSNDDFADYVLASVGAVQKDYIAIIKGIALDALSRQQSMPALIEKLFVPPIASFLMNMHKAVSGPSLVSLLDSDKLPVSTVFCWLEDELGIEDNTLGYRLYDDSTGENKNGREALQRWRQGLKLPALQSVHLLRQRLCGAFPHRKKLIGVFTEWVIVARALTVFDETAKPYADLRSIILTEVLSGVPPQDIGQFLSYLNIDAAKTRRELVESGLLLQERLKRTTSKTVGDQGRSRYALDQFRHKVKIQEPDKVSVYYLEWMEGRWHILANQLEQALVHYERAADLALYRSGETQKDILREALLLAAYQGNLPLYKRLKHRALVMGFSFLPGWDDQVATRHELKAIRGNFESRFPTRGRFIDGEPQFDIVHA